eukprot:GSA25T00025929001.1
MTRRPLRSLAYLWLVGLHLRDPSSLETLARRTSSSNGRRASAGISELDLQVQLAGDHSGPASASGLDQVAFRSAITRKIHEIASQQFDVIEILDVDFMEQVKVSSSSAEGETERRGDADSPSSSSAPDSAESDSTSTLTTDEETMQRRTRKKMMTREGKRPLGAPASASASSDVDRVSPSTTRLDYPSDVMPLKIRYYKKNSTRQGRPTAKDTNSFHVDFPKALTKAFAEVKSPNISLIFREQELQNTSSDEYYIKATAGASS